MTDSDCGMLSNELIKEAFTKTVEAYLHTSEYDVGIELASKKGDNYLGIVYRAICRKTAIDENSNELKIIIKMAPQVEQRRQTFFSRLCFLREIYLFDEVGC